MRLLLSCALLVCATTGCDGRRGQASQADHCQWTPELAMVEWQLALIKNDLVRFDQCFGTMTEDQRNCVHAIFHAAQAAWKLKDKLEERFGPDAWSDLLAHATSGSSAVQLVVPPPKDRLRLNLNDVHVDGEKAVYENRWGDSYPTRFTLEDGRWVVDVSYFTAGNPRLLETVFVRFTATCTRLLDRLAAEETTLDQIKQDFALAVRLNSKDK